MQKLVFDYAAPMIDESAFHNSIVWRDLYGEGTEELLPRMPKPLGKLCKSDVLWMLTMPVILSKAGLIQVSSYLS